MRRMNGDANVDVQKFLNDVYIRARMFGQRASEKVSSAAQSHWQKELIRQMLTDRCL